MEKPHAIPASAPEIVTSTDPSHRGTDTETVGATLSSVVPHWCGTDT